MIKRHTAVLIIHGIAGGTYDEELFAIDCEMEHNFDVFMFTLPGHDVRSFRHSKKEEWLKASEDKLKYLIDNGYKKVYLFGHSMGGVIACYLAGKYKQVKKVVLCAPAFDHIEKEAGSLYKTLLQAPSIISAYSVDEFATRLTKLPISGLKEFTKLVDTYQYAYKDLTVPTMIVHGSKDQLVPIKSTREIFKELNTTHKVYLTVKGYYHDLFKGNKVHAINKEIIKFLKEKPYKIKEEKIEL